ncbi:dubious peptide deformylase [Ectocarpus siliculosus]|uniref:Peptide deformylase n=1 Tax=Ectocarpus siliculosus TaxID=2880 RepID=D8LQR3_ECTSI|nr:dubious peptide deformylase [Ectocarpus siliculosus]|eukprot:CBN74940.1 dubious peptide deformylase [Ectocarpus siliculosus]
MSCVCAWSFSIDFTEGVSFWSPLLQVERRNWVKVEAVNAKGKKVKKKYTDWTARIFQHEYDHLDGTVYIDHLSPPEREKVQPVLDKLVSDFGEDGAL